MEDRNAEFDKFFNPEDLSEWMHRPPEQVLAIICSELRTPIATIRGYIDILLMEPIAERIALTSKDGETKTLREILEIVQKSAYMIYRIRETIFAYGSAYGEQNLDN